MPLTRRFVLKALPAAPLALAASPARAGTTDLVLNCDTALAAPMRVASRRFAALGGARVRVFATPPGAMLPQLARAIQNDLVITRQAVLDEAAAQKLVAPDAPTGLWDNRLVLAGRPGADRSALRGRMAVSDATAASDHDGPAILRALGASPASVQGVIDTDEVAWLLARNLADAGLLHSTDLRANPGLVLLGLVPEAIAPAPSISIAVTTLARRPHPEAFVRFLTGTDGQAVMKAHGLEASA